MLQLIRYTSAAVQAGQQNEKFTKQKNEGGVMKLFRIFIFAAILLLAVTIWAGVPEQINFQGILADSGGTPLDDTTVSVDFRIYDALVGGSTLWAETLNVTTDDQGRFSLTLGAVNPIQNSIFNDSTRFLGVKVESDLELVPRTRLVSVAYAHRVSPLNGNKGLEITVDSTLTIPTGKVGVGLSNPLNTLTLPSNGSFTSTGLFPGILMGTSEGQTVQIIIGRDESHFVQLAFEDEFFGQSARLLLEGNHPLRIISGVTITLSTNSIDRIHISNAGDVGIGTSSPQGALDVSSTTGALIVPRITTAQRDALTAVNGMLIYHTTPDT